MKYMSLKNMTEEEKKARKRKQKNEAQKRYYQKNKNYYNNYSKQWSKENSLKKDKEIEKLNNIINEKNKEIEDYSNKWCELAKAKTKSDNIINELEEYICAIEYDERNYNETWQIAVRIHNKLKELKGSDKE